MVTRREFGQSLMAGAGVLSIRRALAQESRRPCLRVIGMAAYRQEGTGSSRTVKLFLPKAHDHRPFLVAHKSVFEKGGSRLPRGWPLGEFHPDLDDSDPDDYRFACIEGTTGVVNDKGQATVMAPHLAPIRDVARAANEPGAGAEWAPRIPADVPTIELRSGSVRQSPLTNAPGHRTHWEFRDVKKVGKEETTAYGRFVLTDVSEFRSSHDSLAVSLSSKQVLVKLDQTKHFDAWIINLPPHERDDGDPDELEHGDYYFEFFQRHGEPPANRPRPNALLKQPTPTNTDVRHPCLVSAGPVKVRTPPDSEFCYQALV